MPCCCKDNVQASLVLGIIFEVLSLILICIGASERTDPDGERTKNLLYGIYGALISGILILGAILRNPTVILIWMVLALIGVVLCPVLAVFAFPVTATNFYTMSLFFFALPFFFWTIFVAIRAREELQGEGVDGVIFKTFWSKILYLAQLSHARQEQALRSITNV